jgi:ABC-type cobalamin transport system ATPase subunit
MIVKSTVYFNIEKQENAKITNLELFIESLNEQLEEQLTRSSFKLSGSRWNSDRIDAYFVTRAEALEILRTKK